MKQKLEHSPRPPDRDWEVSARQLGSYQLAAQVGRDAGNENRKAVSAIKAIKAQLSESVIFFAVMNCCNCINFFN